MLKRQILVTAIFCTVSLNIFGQHITSDSNVEQAQPFSNSAVTLKPSCILEREMLDIEYIKSLDADRLLYNFRVNANLPSDAKPLEGWEAPNIGLRGHFT